MILGRCQICDSGNLEHFVEYSSLPRVTSDCRPWLPGGTLAFCSNCGAVQKLADAAWQQDCAAIYRDYAVYSLSGGCEQPVFTDGQAVSRSRTIIKRISEEINLAKAGSLLDIGCGNGGFLSAFGKTYAGWDLHGAELDDRNRATLDVIPNFRCLHVGNVTAIGRKFEAVSLIHSLEHLPKPSVFLTEVRDRLLTDDGLLIVEVPDYSTNPFDLVIADHLMHFSTPVLHRLLAAAGFAPLLITGNWVAKEHSILARPGKPTLPPWTCRLFAAG
jgi:SAM-dependent methyltransferase